MFASAIKQWFSPSPLRQQAHQAYVQVVDQSRKPVFYSDWQVADTVDGRFDVLVLHLFLMLSRLGREQGNPEAQAFGRYLSEIFFSDMDRSLREMGAGDTGVGVRIKNMAQAFYGRMKAYEAAINETILAEGALAEAIKRNVYRERAVPPEVIVSLAAYTGRNYQGLKVQALDALLSGAWHFSN